MYFSSLLLALRPSIADIKEKLPLPYVSFLLTPIRGIGQTALGRSFVKKGPLSLLTDPGLSDPLDERPGLGAGDVELEREQMAEVDAA